MGLLQRIQIAWLLIVVCVTSVGAANLPEFSWETVPRWGFFSFSGESVTDEEARYIADNFPIATLFWVPRGSLGDRQQAEMMMLRSAKLVKELNPDLKLLYYWNSTLAFDHYAAFREFEANPSWKMVDREGKDVTVRGSVLRYDVTNSELREWWSEQAAIANQSPYIDGLFVDAVAKVELNKRNVYDARMAPGDFEKSVAGIHAMLALTKRKIGEENLLIYNGLRGDLRPGLWEHGGLEYLADGEGDGACMEHFLIHSVRAPDQSLRVDHVLRDIELIREASSRGKIVLVKAWPNVLTFLEPEFKAMSMAEKEAVMRREITFPLALFLIAAEKNCYFNYSYGYQRECLPLYHLPEYDKPLGQPLGTAIQDGDTFTRSFEHADVRVNLSREEAGIVWK